MQGYLQVLAKGGLHLASEILIGLLGKLRFSTEVPASGCITGLNT